MTGKRKEGDPNIGTTIARGYAVAAFVLLSALALRAPSLEAWFRLSPLVLLSLLVSLRSALVWAYRRTPSRLNWWLRPTAASEREFDLAWLVYAIVFAAASVIPFFLL